MLLLAAASVAASVVLLYVFNRTSRPAAIRAARHAVSASLLEMRLFGDEPAVALRAFASLWIANLRWLQSMAIPSLATGAVFALLYLPFDAAFGTGPMHPGGRYVVTARIAQAAELRLSTGFVLDSPPVRDAVREEVSWRIRVVEPVRGQLEVGGMTKSLDASPGTALRFPRRFYPDGRWVEVDYPAERTDIPLHWMVWFLLILSATVWYQQS